MIVETRQPAVPNMHLHIMNRQSQPTSRVHSRAPSNAFMPGGSQPTTPSRRAHSRGLSGLIPSSVSSRSQATTPTRSQSRFTSNFAMKIASLPTTVQHTPSRGHSRFMSGPSMAPGVQEMAPVGEEKDSGFQQMPPITPRVAQLGQSQNNPVIQVTRPRGDSMKSASIALNAALFQNEEETTGGSVQKCSLEFHDEGCDGVTTTDDHRTLHAMKGLGFEEEYPMLFIRGRQIVDWVKMFNEEKEKREAE
ncbi:hypothetical protein BU23DRAFT_256472 [Bimuria novae-zelandiae CBS 107.79]|uniref:Uncharacterized protein n=1 Tax=Bimuria novae-zelandiae CBS 107.79 TaxID=1447943 RepID=A0A6A5UVT1_9PLEO|nr:hypothetical protein BU23DRAFT_256472 [Bimuria novae-zelandiae CBS 107.79]